MSFRIYLQYITSCGNRLYFLSIVHSNVLDRLVVQLRLQLLVLGHLSDSLHKVLVYHILSLRPDGEEASLCANVSQISAVEPIGELHNSFEVNLAMLCDGVGVDLEHLHAGLLVRQRDLDLSIQSSRPQKSRVQGVWSVGCHNHLDLAKDIKTIHLVEQLHQGSLDLSVGTGALAEPPSSNGVDLVHEDDARLVVSRVVEHLPNQPGRLANVLVHDGAGSWLEFRLFQLPSTPDHIPRPICGLD